MIGIRVSGIYRWSLVSPSVFQLPYPVFHWHHIAFFSCSMYHFSTEMISSVFSQVICTGSSNQWYLFIAMIECFKTHLLFSVELWICFQFFMKIIFWVLFPPPFSFRVMFSYQILQGWWDQLNSKLIYLNPKHIFCESQKVYDISATSRQAGEAHDHHDHRHSSKLSLHSDLEDMYDFLSPSQAAPNMILMTRYTHIRQLWISL